MPINPIYSDSQNDLLKSNPKGAESHIVSTTGNKKWVLSMYDYLIDLVIRPWFNNQPLKVKYLNWWGSRYTGKTVQAILLAILLSLIHSNKKIIFYGVRKEIQNKKEFFDTILEHWPPELSYTINQKYTTIKTHNLYMEIIGLTKYRKEVAEKLGKTRRNADLTIICFDEAYQFDKTDFLNVMGAVGLKDNALIIKCANPYNPHADFFKDVLKVIPWTKELASSEYMKIKQTKDSIYHFSTSYAIWNEGVLGKTDQETIEKADLIDPVSGEVYKWGRPLELKGGVYTKEMKNIISHAIPSWLSSPNRVPFCGIDFGYSKDPTAIVFGMISPGHESVYIAKELVIGTEHTLFSVEIQVNKILEFMFSTFQKWDWNDCLTIYCDIDFAFVDTFNTILEKCQLKHNGKYLRDYIAFRMVAKNYIHNKIDMRIKNTLRAMATKSFYASKIRTPHLWQELSNMHWKESAHHKKLIRDDGNDHAINAFEYGVVNYLPYLGSLR